MTALNNDLQNYKRRLNDVQPLYDDNVAIFEKIKGRRKEVIGGIKKKFYTHGLAATDEDISAIYSRIEAFHDAFEKCIPVVNNYKQPGLLTTG